MGQVGLEEFDCLGGNVGLEELIEETLMPDFIEGSLYV